MLDEFPHGVVGAAPVCAAESNPRSFQGFGVEEVFDPGHYWRTWLFRSPFVFIAATTDESLEPLDRGHVPELHFPRLVVDDVPRTRSQQGALAIEGKGVHHVGMVRELGKNLV